MPTKSSPIKSDMVRARITPELKNEAETILKKLGISSAQAITMLFTKIVEEQGWPYELRISKKKN